MAATVDLRTGLEELDQDECLRLLRGATLGRLAIVIAGQPMVFPVNFTLDGRAVIIRTDEGTKLWAARHGLVAFECDEFDAMYHTGWSVVVGGRAEEVQNVAEIARLKRLPLGPWGPGPKPVWLRIRPRILTGRRIPLHGTHRPEGSQGDKP